MKKISENNISPIVRKVTFKENQLNILNGFKDLITIKKPNNNMLKLICDTYDIEILQLIVE